MSEGSILRGRAVPQVGDEGIHTIFEQLAANNPEKPIIVHGDTRLTLGEVNARANQVSRGLLQTLRDYSLDQLQRNDKIVCLLMPPCPDRVIAILALLKLGLAYLPLEVVIPTGRIRYIIREAKPLCIISSDDLLSHINKSDVLAESVRIFLYGKFLSENASDGNLAAEETLVTPTTPIADCLALVLYTSGSTGLPKGVRLTHSNVMNRLRWQWNEFPYAKDDFGIAKTSILFVDSVTEVWGPLLKGVPIVMVPKCVTQNPERFIETLEKHQVTRLVLVPSLLRNMLTYLKMVKDYTKLSKLVHVVCSGETLPIELAKDFFQYFKNGHVLANYYGSTETTGDVTFEVFRNTDDVDRMTFKENMSIGKMVDNCTAYVVDEEMQPVPLGEMGELIVSGQNIADGFVDTKNMANFLPNTLGVNKDKYLLKTGDYARVVDGRIYYEGRKDSQVKIRGQRVDTSEIARTLQTNDLTEQVVVLVHNNKEGDATIVAFYTTKGKKELNQQLETFCKKSLPPYMVPRFLFLEDIPLLPATGKIDRQSLKLMYEDSLRASGDVAFDDEMTGRVVGVVAGELGLHPSHIDLSQNFFEIGGNSVNAITTLAKLLDAGIRIEIADFLAAKSLQETVDLAKGAADIEKEDALKILEAKYKVVPVGPDFGDKDAVFHLLNTAFSEKEILDLSAGLSYQDIGLSTERIYPACQKSQASFAVYTKTGHLVGASLSGNISDVNPVRETFAGERLHLVGEALIAGEVFLEGVTEGKWLANLMMAADERSNPEDNLEIMEFMERKTIQMAKEAGYDGIETMNTNQVTIQLGRILGYETTGILKIREITDETGKPILPSAPEDALIDVAVMRLN